MAKPVPPGEQTGPPRSPGAQATNQQDALGRLLDAVPVALQHHGWPGLDANELCASACVGGDAFAQHFADEQDCFLCAYRYHADRLVEAVRATPCASEDACEIRATFAALLGFLAVEPAVAELILVRVLEAGPAAVAERDRTAAALSGLIAGRVLPGPVDRAVAGALRRTTGGAVAQLLYAWVTSGRAEQLLELLPTCTYLALVASHEPGDAAAMAGLAGASA